MNTVKKLINLSVISTIFLSLSLEAKAVSIGYFNNFEYTPTFIGDNFKNVLTNGTNTVTEFNSLNASVWQQIVENNQVVVLPSLRFGSLTLDLPTETKTVIRNFVDNGGGLLMSGEVIEVISFFNNIFGFSFDEDFWSESTLLTDNAQGTIFESAPSSLGSPFQTTTMALNSLPPNSIVFYDNLSNSPSNRQNSTSVFVTPFGMGNIAFNGYDYGQSEDDTGWPEVTNLTIEFIANDSDVESVPEPSTINSLIMIAGVGLLSLFKKLS